MTMTMIPEKNPDLIWRSLDDETVIINPEQGDVKVLNDVGARVWELADGQRSISQIAGEISRVYEVSLDEANVDLLGYLEVMMDQGLMHWHAQDG